MQSRKSFCCGVYITDVGLIRARSSFVDVVLILTTGLLHLIKILAYSPEISTRFAIDVEINQQISTTGTC